MLEVSDNFETKCRQYPRLKHNDINFEDMRNNSIISLIYVVEENFYNITNICGTEL